MERYDTGSRAGASDWSHVRIRPSTSPIDAHRLPVSFGQLHEFDSPVECLLLSRRGDEQVSYYFGTPGPLSPLLRILGSTFPDDYGVTEEALSLNEILAESEASSRPEHETIAVDFLGEGQRRGDWQTRLQPAGRAESALHFPLSDITEILSAHQGTTVYQALISPKPPWTVEAEIRRERLECHEDTFGQRWVMGYAKERDEDESQIDPAHLKRLEEIDAKDTRHSFDVDVRLLVTGPDSEQTVREVNSVFRPLNGQFYGVTPDIVSDDVEPILERIRCRSTRPTSLSDRARSVLPFTTDIAPTVVTDLTTIPNFTILSGAHLDTPSDRALQSTPAEQTSLPRPPQTQLDTYRSAGLTLGVPLTQDGTREREPVALPPALQPMHVAWFGKTGSGKSTALVNAILSNHDATDGADILIDPKGDGMAEQYLQAHYQTYGTLENVLHFDCTSVLPAFSFFDIRDELEAGIPRTTAVEDIADHYIEILTQIMGRDRFEQAVRSPDIIKFLVKAMFDPVNDLDAFSHSNLHASVRSMHERKSAPPVSDPNLERMLAGVTANQKRSFDKIMQGVANRIEKIPLDDRLAELFDHVPRQEHEPHFDLANHLDEDVVILLDTGGLRSEAQRVLTLVVLSNLWTALRRRRERSHAETLPLVNLYVEEAASIAVSELLNELLAQARSFDCSVTLAMQYPAQLREQDPATYDEVLNNVSTFVTGNVPLDQRLSKRLAHEDMAPPEVGNRLRALRRGQWFLNLPAGFGNPEPRPFLVQSVDQPPRFDEGSEKKAEFDTAFEDASSRTLFEAGLPISDEHLATGASGTGERGKSESGIVRIDSALPYTSRMPPTVEYNPSLHALECTECMSRYRPRISGMRRAIECCSSLDEVDKDDIPICDVDLKLSSTEVKASDWSSRQLVFCQAVYNAQRGWYDPLEYDLLTDSMIRLEEYIDIESESIQQLVDEGLLWHDTDFPHRLYSVNSEGRKAIGESHRRGIDYGHGIGDLNESSLHIMAVEVGRRYLEKEYVEDPDSPVTEVVPYYDVSDDGRILPVENIMGDSSAETSPSDGENDPFRLDVAALDDDGNVRIAIEAERIDNNPRRSIPGDYDKLARLNLTRAIWLVMSGEGGHEVLNALREPLEGDPRIEKSYSQNTSPREFTINQPGLTDMYTLGHLRSRVID